MTSGNVYFRMFLYFIISVLITLGLEIEQLNADHLHEITYLMWVKIAIKALLPALISIRAYLDTSMTKLHMPKIKIKS